MKFEHFFLLENNRNNALEGLRGIAVLMVFYFHFNPLNSKFLMGGHIGVDIFFVLSGYLIWKLLFKNVLNPYIYLRDRIYRLMPAYILTLLLIWVIHYTVSESYKGLIANIFFLPAVIPGLEYINFVAWSLGWEWIFYIFIVTVLVLKNIQKIFLYIIFLICILLLLMEWEISSLANIVRFFGFFFGCLVGYTIDKLKPNRLLEIFGIIAFCSLLISSGSYGYIPNLHNGWASIFFYLFVDLAASLAIVYLLKFNSIVTEIISARFIVFVGRISYSIYLAHSMITIYISEKLISFLDIYNVYFNYLFPQLCV